MKATGARIIVECLKEQGVDTVFGYPGGKVIPIFDELYKTGDCIRQILPTHEQGGAHAADGYARATGRVGVCFATSGPGATNLVTGIATAFMDSVPMMFITGNVNLDQIGTDGFQEVDTIGITMPITKNNVLVKHVDQLAPAIRGAFKLARSGRPGPVLIDVPGDVQTAVTEYTPEVICTAIPEKCDREAVLAEFEKNNKKSLDKAAQMLMEAKKPLILVGGGVIRSGATEVFAKFAETVQAPVCCSLMGLGAFPASNPLYFGNVGMHGNMATNTASTLCDLFIAIGTRFSDRISGDPGMFLPEAKLLHLDIDRAEISKNVVANHHVVGDAGIILELLLKRLHGKLDHSDWLDEIEELKRSAPKHETVCCGKLDPREMMLTLRSKIGDDAIVATDVGQHQMWVAMHMPFEKPRTLITSGGMGTMGFGLGAAIGAKLGCPDKTVVLVTGDGSFRMNCGELATMRYYDAPVIIVLMNNGTLGMVRQWQTLFFGKRYSMTTLDRGPDFCKLAAAYGIDSHVVTNMDEYVQALDAALAKGGPAILDCRIDIDEMVRPMVGPGKPLIEFVVE